MRSQPKVNFPQVQYCSDLILGNMAFKLITTEYFNQKSLEILNLLQIGSCQRNVFENNFYSKGQKQPNGQDIFHSYGLILFC